MVSAELFGVTAADVGEAGQAERNFLACCLRSGEIDGNGLDDAAAVVGPGDFAHHAHGIVFRAILAVRAAGVPVEAATVYDQLRKCGHLVELGEQPQVWLAELLDLQPTGVMVGYYAAEVRDAAKLRALKRAHVEMGRELLEPNPDVGEIAARCERIIFEASAATATATGPRSVFDLVAEELHDLDGRISGERPVGVPTGFHEIDALLSGMRPGQLVVVGARPGVGKSAFSLCLAANAAARGTAALFACMEMSNAEMVQRLLAVRSGVRLTSIREGSLNDDQIDQLHRAAPIVQRLPLHFEDAPNVTADRMAATVRRAVRRNGVGLVCVDYLQLLEPENRRENKNAQIGLLARRMKLIARECGIPLVLMCQLNREAENRPDAKPRLADLRDSGEIEQHADIVLLLSPQRGQTADEKTLLVDCTVAKNRNGPIGEVTLRYVRAITRFEDAPR